MKNIKLNILRGSVMALAIVGAFAFTQPATIQGYGTMDNGATWHDLSDPNVNYRCNANPSQACVYEEKDITSTVLVDGEFELLP